MRVIFAAGGTAGHINPAIAMADYIKSRDFKSEILFIGTATGMEYDLVKKAGYDFSAIDVRGFQRKLNFSNIIKNIGAIRCVLYANIASKKIIKSFSPDIVIGTGGYVSGPVVMSAHKLKIKTAIHEQNAYPGITNKILSSKADVVFSANEKPKKYFDKDCDFLVVGNPIRESILYKTKLEARRELGIDESFCILSFGGSLGATKINEIAYDIIKWHKDLGDVNHIHAFGKFGESEFLKKAEQEGMDFKNNKRIIVKEYIDNMDSCLAAADLIICRSGAITISEIQATGSASILIPSPYVSENHQYHNAKVLVENNAAYMIEEKNYNKTELIGIIENLYKNIEKLNTMGKNALNMSILDTNVLIYDKIVKLLNY